MHISEEKRRALIIGLSSIILLALDIAFIIMPLVHKSSDLKYQIVAVRRNINDLENQISRLDENRKRLESLKAERLNYEKRFPKEEEIPSLLEGLSLVAARSSVDIIGVKPIRLERKEEVEKSRELYHEIPIEILAKGGYHQLAQFINKLENMDRFMKVVDAAIVQVPTMPRRHFLRLLVETYILRT